MGLTDFALIDLYEARSESAIEETAKQYGSFCTAISMRILHNREDAEEVANDAYLKVWSLIPPQRPLVFSSFLAKITKNLALDKYRASKAKKRGFETTALMLSELEECIDSGFNLEKEVDSIVFKELIQKFLHVLEKNDRLFFMRRYWHNDSIIDISRRYNVSESKVKSNLFRTRNKLKTYLEKEGIHYE